MNFGYFRVKNIKFQTKLQTGWGPASASHNQLWPAAACTLPSPPGALPSTASTVHSISSTHCSSLCAVEPGFRKALSLSGVSSTVSTVILSDSERLSNVPCLRIDAYGLILMRKQVFLNVLVSLRGSASQTCKRVSHAARRCESLPSVARSFSLSRRSSPTSRNQFAPHIFCTRSARYYSCCLRRTRLSTHIH
jgi:hypothetical protein